MRVMLVHGMGRTTWSMRLLAHRLEAAGHTTHLFGYAVSREGFEEISRRFARFVTSTTSGRAGERYAIVGHSLGGIVARHASPSLPDGLARLVMLGPPNRSPSLARRLKTNPLFRVLTADAGARLADPSFFETLPVVPVPTLVIAGDAVTRGPLASHRGERSDGIVTVDETRLEGAAHVVLPQVHTFLMNDRTATQEILRFLRDE